MGNHSAGRAMGRAAELALQLRTTQTALDLLDQICTPYKGCDAEFEAEDPNNPGRIHPDYTFYDDPEGPLGKLIAEAFGPERTDWAAAMRASATEFYDPITRACSTIPQPGSLPASDGNPVYEEWCDGPGRMFRDRYQFC